VAAHRRLDDLDDLRRDLHDEHPADDLVAHDERRRLRE
jgi:hypothetical protein